MRSITLALAIPLSLMIAAPAFGQDTAEAAAETPPVHFVKFDGVYADLPEMGGDLTTLLLGGGVGKPKSFYGMLEELGELETKDGDTVLVDLTGTFSINAVQIAELERAMERVRKAGKHCYAYLENGDPSTYQIAALCDEVLMPDLGALDLPSRAMQVMFMKDALDLLGIQFDVVRCGDFKGAVEPYMLSSMSKHLRAHYEAMLEHLNDDMVQRIARARGLDAERVRELQARRLMSAKQAKEAGLIDRIVRWRGAEDALGTVLEDEFETENALTGKKKRKSFNPMQFFAQMFRPQEEEEVEESALVVLHLSGGIVDGAKPVPGSIVSGPSVETIVDLTENDNVKGVVVRINSPGGSATASEAILLALQDLAKKKPVVISMGSVAASGGYYIACLDRPILAEKGTITGSIGVFGMKPSAGALMRRVGIHMETIALDEAAGMMAIDQSWTDEQKQVLQDHVDHIYDVFVGHVSRARSMSKDAVLAIAGGRVWSGEQAMKNGLVDSIGGVGDALAMVAKEAGVEDYELKHVPRPKSFMDSIAEELLSASIELPEGIEKSMLRKLNLDRALRVILDSLENEQPARVWAMMPDAITVR